MENLPVLKLFIVLAAAVEAKPGNVSEKYEVRILAPLMDPMKIFEEESQAITFPDELEPDYEKIASVDYDPSCARGKTFCEDIETYPYDHLSRVLNNASDLKDFFAMDEGGGMQLVNRIGEKEDKFLCDSIERTIYPKVAKTKNNKWKYVINQGKKDGYVQGVRIEMCKNAHRPCNLIGNLPFGYAAICKQKYVLRRMLSITDGGRPIPDTFEMPSACCCSYRRIG
ncbi:PREDICTED: protein spaetzle-like [Nicrophorus vespilloides]|uniref:Protein spaetzle-like n=1 Tax=Nicrophorus vespilloides TaxID=110193 RepID=A0ABM1MEA1_NICVS|nr:PREDICTED: protein spaetzle-like [Nicrophorus vespilloides]